MRRYDSGNSGRHRRSRSNPGRRAGAGLAGFAPPPGLLPASKGGIAPAAWSETLRRSSREGTNLNSLAIASADAPPRVDHPGSLTNKVSGTWRYPHMKVEEVMSVEPAYCTPATSLE